MEMDDPAAQVQYWRTRLETARFRAGLAIVINPLALRVVYSPTFVRVLPRRFDRIIRGRLMGFLDATKSEASLEVA